MKIHPCKHHDNAHDYARCSDCGHEYCPHYWLSCPSCWGTGNGNLTSAAKAENVAKRRALRATWVVKDEIAF